MYIYAKDYKLDVLALVPGILGLPNMGRFILVIRPIEFSSTRQGDIPLMLYYYYTMIILVSLPSTLYLTYFFSFSPTRPLLPDRGPHTYNPYRLFNHR